MTEAPPAATMAEMRPTGPLVWVSVKLSDSWLALESANSAAICWAMSASSYNSKLTGTNVAAFLAVMDGWASTGLSSETSVASGSHDDVAPADVTKRFSLSVVVSTRQIARIGSL